MNRVPAGYSIHCSPWFLLRWVESSRLLTQVTSNPSSAMIVSTDSLFSNVPIKVPHELQSLQWRPKCTKHSWPSSHVTWLTESSRNVAIYNYKNGFNICFNMRSTQLLNQMSGAFEQVVQHCWKRVESNLNWFKLLFNFERTFSLFLKMLNGVETVWTLRSSNIRSTFVDQMLGKSFKRVFV